jgi:hypothetical protein
MNRQRGGESFSGDNVNRLESGWPKRTSDPVACGTNVDIRPTKTTPDPVRLDPNREDS